MEVRQLRQSRGWNQTELAYHAGLAPSVISQIENGKRQPSSGTLQKLAKAFDVEVGDLFPKLEAPLPLEDPERRARVEDLADHISARADEVEEEVNNPDSRHFRDNIAVHPWSVKRNREYRVLAEDVHQLKPSPGEESDLLDGALDRLWQALEAGKARADARGEAWDHALDDLRTERTERPATR